MIRKRPRRVESGKWTLGGYEARTRLVAAIGGRDLPIALLEDALAVLGALAIVRWL
jgi:uncharacterized membrane protein